MHYFSFILNYLWEFGYRNYLHCSQPFESKQIKSVTKQIKKAKVTNPSIDYSLLEIQLNEKKTWLQTWFLDFYKLHSSFSYQNQKAILLEHHMFVMHQFFDNLFY